MQPPHSEHRREPRIHIEAGTSVELHSNGQVVRATTVNMSGCGVLLQFAEPPPFTVGDSVTCNFKLPKEEGEPLPSWGLGTVVRLDGACAAIDFRGGGWMVPDCDSREKG